MRTTLDLPDPLFRRLKSRAALEGLPLKDLIARFVTAGLQRSAGADSDRVAESDAEPGTGLDRTVTAFDLMQDGAGIARSGRRDLATNPRHMEGFGRD